jgi:tRNA(Ile)-lysidine synthase
MLTADQGLAAPHNASSDRLPGTAALQFLKTLKTPCHLLVAYSGGSDSTGLLVALSDCIGADDLAITLSVATVDHGLRPGSAKEAIEAGGLCRRLGIVHAILAWEGEKPRTGMQAAARAARYRLLAQHAAAIGADAIVTGHTLDDQIETSAMRQARNPASVGGMAEAVLIERRLWVYRPFLEVRRSAIRALLAARQIGWAEDPSNDNDVFERVRVRKARGAYEPVADFAGIAAARRLRLDAAAQLLAAHAALHAGRVGELDLARHGGGDGVLLDAIVHLAALIGGRSHAGGQQTAERIAAFLQGQQRCLAIDRVVLDRRGDRLYLVREQRLLPVMTIEPGATAVWDNRFRIANAGTACVTIGPCRPDVACRALLPDVPAGLPGAVRQLAAATEPVVLGRNAHRLDITPILAHFDAFVPIASFGIAEILAKLGGLAHLPLPPSS